jgi:hypothetical protein
LESAQVGLSDGHGVDVKVRLGEVIPEPPADHVCKVIVSVYAVSEPAARGG